MRRETVNNLRDYIDNNVVEQFRHWPKSEPIQIVDVVAGKLLQTATIVTSLVKAGFQVELSIVDSSFDKGWNNDSIKTLVELFSSLKSQSKFEYPAKLIGVFTNIDSYLATAKGLEPLKHEVVTRENLSQCVKEGKKRRYLKVKGEDDEEHNIRRRNEIFENEFKTGGACKNKMPALVLVVDDLTEFFPLLVSPEDYQTFPEQYRDFAFRNEILTPIMQLNSEAIFIGTHKRFSSSLLQKVEVVKIQHGVEKVLCFGSFGDTMSYGAPTFRVCPDASTLAREEFKDDNPPKVEEKAINANSGVIPQFTYNILPHELKDFLGGYFSKRWSSFLFKTKNAEESWNALPEIEKIKLVEEFSRVSTQKAGQNILRIKIDTNDSYKLLSDVEKNHVTWKMQQDSKIKNAFISPEEYWNRMSKKEKSSLLTQVSRDLGSKTSILKL
ncbi:MAG: hypothetical protein ABI597_06350 [Gammaproteobacteria bacterium]